MASTEKNLVRRGGVHGDDHFQANFALIDSSHNEFRRSSLERAEISLWCQAARVLVLRSG